MTYVKIFSKSGEIPKYETENSAGLDLRAMLVEPLTIKPMERVLIPTGIFLEIPNGFEGQVRARSGLSIKNGLTMVNGVGTVDADYRGELKVPMINLGSEDFTVESGDRIAQIVFARYENVKFEPVDSVESLEKTKRGAGGFGHTGR